MENHSRDKKLAFRIFFFFRENDEFFERKLEKSNEFSKQFNIRIMKRNANDLIIATIVTRAMESTVF